MAKGISLRHWRLTPSRSRDRRTRAQPAASRTSRNLSVRSAARFLNDAFFIWVLPSFMVIKLPNKITPSL